MIEASAEGVLRFATAQPAARPRLENIKQIDIKGVPTFTDALQQYERESGVALRGLNCAMAVAGAVSGETLSPARSRWTITRTGLAAVFGKPVTILNDVQARSWAIKSGSATTETLRGVGAPSLGRHGRYIMLMVEEGVGAAVVDVDRDGMVHILETEGGHMDFPPGSEREEKLARAVRGITPHASWEMMLMLERNSAAWNSCPEVADGERSRLLANLLGRFAVNLMHAYGAWQGVMITGGRAGRMLEPGTRSAFDAAFNERRNFSRLVIGCPAWRVEQRDAVLTGAAECLAQNVGVPVRQQAA
ncbi:MAG: glucokinase [Sphingomicrobium sp.]